MVKLQNIMTRIVWQFSFCSLLFQRSFSFLEKVLIWLKKVTYISKLPVSKNKSFLKPNFDLTQTCKIELTQNHEISDFNATDLFDIFIKERIMLCSYEKYQKVEVWRKLGSNLLRQSRTKHIWNKVKKSSKIGQD